MKLTCVSDRDAAQVLEPLREAARARGVEYAEVVACDFDYDPARRLPRGDLLYRQGITSTALRVEQFLYAPGVATFYGNSCDRPFFAGSSQPFHFAYHGIPVPETVYCASAGRTHVDAQIARLGGFPLLAKMGGQAGVGVVMLESRAALQSFVEFALAAGREPSLTAFVHDAVMWRIVVVGTRAVAAYTAVPEARDFRASGVNDSSVFTTDPPAEVADLAIRAVKAVRLEFGGVDVLQSASGCYVLESNFPCYYPLAQIEAGIDVAGAMLDHLLAQT